jgi:hypothetical protein
MNDEVKVPARDAFRINDEDYKPYTHLRFKNDPDDFQFAIIADNAGGARPGVLTAAMELVNLLQPEFVVNVGDLIEGYSEDEGEVREWWQELDNDFEQLDMPFFFVPGNHDINTDASLKVWRERFGGNRDYYHFVYKNVLFLMVSTEDPPKQPADLEKLSPERYKLISESYQTMQELQAKEHLSEEDAVKLLEIAEPIEEWVGEINISNDQVAYFKEVLEANPDVRWTFCFLHSPPWQTASGVERDPGNFLKIEDLLADRSYTVFAAHTHTYEYIERNGRDYITTACTGALNVPRPGAIDHVVWVTMTDQGPKIVNLLLNGMLDKRGPVEGMEDMGLFRPRPNP